MTQVQFNFEEVKIPLLGEDALFRGLATLDSASEDDSEFYVSLVQIGDLSLRRPSRINSANAVGDFLFNEIVKQIEDDKTVVGRQAVDAWTDEVAGNIQPIPALRRRAGMPLAYSTLKTIPEIDMRAPSIARVGH